MWLKSTCSNFLLPGEKNNEVWVYREKTLKRYFQRMLLAKQILCFWEVSNIKRSGVPKHFSWSDCGNLVQVTISIIVCRWGQFLLCFYKVFSFFFKQKIFSWERRSKGNELCLFVYYLSFLFYSHQECRKWYINLVNIMVKKY